MCYLNEYNRMDVCICMRNCNPITKLISDALDCHCVVLSITILFFFAVLMQRHITTDKSSIAEINNIHIIILTNILYNVGPNLSL